MNPTTTTPPSEDGSEFGMGGGVWEVEDGGRIRTRTEEEEEDEFGFGFGFGLGLGLGDSITGTYELRFWSCSIDGEN